VLHARIDRIISRAERRGQLKPPNRLAGLVTAATHSARPDLEAALRDTEQCITHRAAQLARNAIEEGPSWLRRLLDQPMHAAGLAEWEDVVAQVAAYRERHGVADDNPLGAEPESQDGSQSRDRRHLRILIATPQMYGGPSYKSGRADAAPNATYDRRSGLDRLSRGLLEP
jgi:hypothetical protein